MPSPSLCLNPCSNGIWSLTDESETLVNDAMSLNPCSNGIWSLTELCRRTGLDEAVLILVLMEYGL